MAKVIKKGKKFCVAHDKTGQIIKRKGKQVCYSIKSQAKKDASKTRCRVMKKC